MTSHGNDRRTSRARPFALLALLLTVAAVHPGCLCVDNHPPREKGPEKTPQDKVKDCLSSCDNARWSCQDKCNKDEACSRACVSAYDKCIDICAGKR